MTHNKSNNKQKPNIIIRTNILKDRPSLLVLLLCWQLTNILNIIMNFRVKISYLAIAKNSPIILPEPELLLINQTK